MSIAMRPVLVALAIGAAAFAALARTPEPPLARDEISAVELADWLRARRPGLLILDTRSAAARMDGSLPGARPVADLAGQEAETIVLYGERGTEAVPLHGVSTRVLRLRGGIEAWNEEVLFPVLRSDAPEAHRREFAARARLSRYFGGSPRVIEPGAEARRTRSRRGC